MKAEPRRHDFRKVQKTGGDSFVVSLPKSWVNDVGLRAKDPVAVLVQSDSSLLIVPRRDLRPASKSGATVESAQGFDKDFLLRHFISYYLAGYDTIMVALGKPDSGLRGFIREGIRRKLVGVEIIEESPRGILTQCLSGYIDLPLKKGLERMAIIAGGMLTDAVSVLQGGSKDASEEVIERDDEVDRFYHFLLRQLNIAVRDRSVIQEIGLTSTRDCLGYRLAVKNVERVADHAAGIAAEAENLRALPEQVVKKIQETTALSKKVFDTSITSLIRLDGKLAEEAIAKSKEVLQMEEKISGEMLAPRMSGTQVASAKLMLESIRRTAEYGSDIAEIAIDLTVAEPQVI
ncbi:MAG: AbrB/MazE/SpoVT family DNA-binding domain-containing protein [Nitrososphaerota archaeon]|nr:AbrB/MazE/SpoVT family DNA-binding domain-containing protein [Nitrososphaerota archaeon]MDG6942318.1 AbrB/MazE/SpoVT family DNA-binding domain-containing protein [Nitrososphaerota archaeon]MDG6942783.1 AbrB/MazE/SpoVT family DNA-binding domain-containing protein [Nitrososphaerota archaeon]MDG6948570.1 AbrB/MazE/SpoVT family DNA-binding domain-containing protein [Nitrososphaerota archaeon]MDG6950496.1 AbrB/MazE/SpoVT family DNA-binding domain-containing protein [Nitrososphaerota archaeon]